MVKRVVVGAHYGLRDWLAQRITALLIATYTCFIFVALLAGSPISHTGLRDLFSRGWMRIATLLAVVALAWHAWVGMRDLLMDYIHATSLRLAMQTTVLLVLATYVAWVVEILWR